MTNVGTPDWQYGVVSAGMLLASIPSGTTSAVVDLPPNTQAVMVVASGANWASGVTCIGQTSNVQYPGLLRTSGAGVTSDISAVFDVSSQVDTSVKIEWGLSPGPVEWYVYSSAGVRVVSDLNTAAMSTTLTSIAKGGLLLVGANVSSGVQSLSTTAVQLAPPHISNRNYLYGFDFADMSGTDDITVSDANGAIAYRSGSAGSSGTIDLGGYQATGAVSAVMSAGTAKGLLRYKVEA